MTHAATTDFFCLIDVSVSMSGAKLDACKEGITQIAALMKPNDRISLIAFDTSAFFKLRPRPVEEVMRKQELPGI